MHSGVIGPTGSTGAAAAVVAGFTGPTGPSGAATIGPTGPSAHGRLASGCAAPAPARPSLFDEEMYVSSPIEFRADRGSATAHSFVPLKTVPPPHSSNVRYGKHILYRDWETYSEVDIQESGALH